MSDSSAGSPAAGSENAWRSFLEGASYVMGHPSFDLQERDRKLEIAQKAQRLIATAGRGEDLGSEVDTLLGSLRDPDRPLILPVHSEWFVAWANSSEPSLGRALREFTSADDALTRFERFVQLAPEDPQGRMVLLFGSLFNFAIEPHALPIVREAPFERVERRLGHEPRPQVGVVEQYEAHLTFTRQVLAELRRGGLEVRDMLDVQGIMLVYSDWRLHWDLPVPASKPGTRRDRGSSQRSSGPEPYLSVSACLGYEAPYLYEWIEFHRLVGVERFFLYNNGDRETHREMLEPYVEDGVVVLTEWPEFPPQVGAAKDCIARYREDSRWIAFVDTDEFLFSATGRPVSDVLRDYEEHPGVGVNWVLFGPSGHRSKPPGLVIENYVQRLPMAGPKFIKSVVDPARTTDCVNPHAFLYEGDGAVDENHYPVFYEATAYVCHSVLQVNHYVTRSEEEFRAKLNTGNPSAGGLRGPVTLEQILLEEKSCGRKDTAILPYVGDLRRALEAAS
jgi:hypothetical protein